jgi:hypothetical protein
MTTTAAMRRHLVGVAGLTGTGSMSVRLRAQRQARLSASSASDP